ncbi:hypothetical protein [Hymenobacter jeollabukensis]|uniref:Uncharacterized protein n=1 Tax=Hymenobacter jeollabukensis TaxID=2025313 RepID=A0A5R8WPG1_9BACT|nr:hypothetical protein [Hymenobacter jeollabukensis]TLM92216.1 hypothetical protein FDY95_12300 [Hymenobacter jeollabukensis]
MGHHIFALVTAGPVDQAQAAAYELPCFLENGYTIIGLNAYHSDYWADKLDIPHRNYSDIILDNDVTRFLARALGLGRYALISTDYFGGSGEQHAAVYDAGQVLMPATAGGINAALRLLGVRRGPLTDEFDAISLGKYRSFEDHFERYYDLD